MQKRREKNDFQKLLATLKAFQWDYAFCFYHELCMILPSSVRYFSSTS